MPRFTLEAWWCWRQHRNDGVLRTCSECGAPRIEKNAQVHASERAVVYLNPSTGEHRTPARADQPLPEVYARQGFERHEIQNMAQYEKSSGTIHEASNFNNGNAEAETVREPAMPKAPKALVDSLINDLRS